MDDRYTIRCRENIQRLIANLRRVYTRYRQGKLGPVGWEVFLRQSKDQIASYALYMRIREECNNNGDSAGEVLQELF
jgi:hypothetical protein